MQSIFELSYVWLAAIIFGSIFSFAFVVHLVTEHSPLAGRLSDYRHIPAAGLTAVAVLFSLFSAFLGADIWERARQERQSVEREIAAVRTIDTIAESLGRQGVQIDRSLKRYVEICVPGMTSATSKTAADQALDEVARQILELARFDATHAPVTAAMLAAFHEIKMARAERLHLEGTHSDKSKWIAVILMGLLVQVAMAFAAPYEPKGQLTGLVIFSAAFSITLAALAIHENPLLESQSIPVEALSRSVDP